MKKKLVMMLLACTALTITGCSGSDKTKETTEVVTETVATEETTTEEATTEELVIDSVTEAETEEATTEEATTEEATTEEATTEEATTEEATTEEATTEEATTEEATTEEATTEEATTEEATTEEVTTEEATTEEATTEEATTEEATTEEATTEEATTEEATTEEATTEEATTEEATTEEATTEEATTEEATTEEATTEEATTEEATTEEVTTEEATTEEATTEEATTEEATTEEATTEEATTEEATTEEESEVETELGDLPEYKASDYVTLGDYKGLEVTEKSPVNVTEEDVMSALEDSIPLENLTEGEVKDGDIANIDYEGTLDGVAFDGGTAQGTDLEIGSGTFIEGFEEGLIGVQVGEAVDLNLTFPESYHSEELAGKDVVFHVTVNSLQRAQDVTDDIVAEISEFKTVEEYKESIRKELEENQASQNRTATEYELINQVYNNATIDGYPEEALAYTLNRAKAYYESYASYYGMTTEDLMAAYGMDEETFMGELENVAKQTLSQEMVLIAVAEKEGLEPTEDEFAEGLEKYAQRAGSDAEALLEQYGENYIRNSLIQEKALEFLYENANISVEEETEIEIASEEETEEVSEAESETETEEVSETESETESESMSESESETESESES